jgi:hypothetical protein
MERILGGVARRTALPEKGLELRCRVRQDYGRGKKKDEDNNDEK